MELESSEPLHNFIYLYETGFNLTRSKRRGPNFIGHRATIVPGQRRGNISMCAAISEHGVLTRNALVVMNQPIDNNISSPPGPHRPITRSHSLEY